MNKEILSLSSVVNRGELEEYIFLLEAKEACLVERLCGKRYNRERRDFVRLKTKKRVILTRNGRVERYFVHVKNVKSGEVFSPLLRELGIGKGQQCSVEFKQVLARKASKMPYRKSVEDIRDSFGFGLSRMTLHKYVQEECSSLDIEQTGPVDHRVLLGDGTKVRNGDGHHEARAIMSIGQDTSDKALLRHAINTTWKDMAKSIDLQQYRAFVGDGEPGLQEALCAPHMKFHYCHEHAHRDVALFLWKDGLGKKEYSQYVERFKSILYCLQHSTEKHKRDKDWSRLSWRILWAKQEIRNLAALLSTKELHTAAGFLMRHVDHFTTAAELAIEGINMPWTTNAIERVMQEIGNRTKKKGMYWSEQGLDNILKMVLKRYFLPNDQRTYKDVFTTSSPEAVKT